MTAVSDNFNRANSTNLGASWTEVTGDWEIVSNKCQNNTDAGGLGYYCRNGGDTGSTDNFAQCVTTSTQASANSNTGVACRMRAAANTSYQLTTRHAGDTIGNWRIVAAAETQLSFQTGASSISTTINSGDTIRLEVVGSLLRSKVQGALVGLTVDTNITDGQLVGLNGWNEVASDVVEVDDFAGGALIADGGLVAPFIAGIGAQVTGTGTTLTPTVPTPSNGDLVLVLLTSRDAAQTMTAPGSEGWSSVESPSQTGLEDVLFAKVWGTGSTDDATPTFSIGAGTAGWGATAVIIRNPAHATFPWTTVASAVVASGSQANASSATVTAPSVSDTGTHRTLARFFSSADDNALLTQNEGALVFGGANYDSTTGNDFAQAMSIREDVTTAGSTSTATVTETLVGNDVNNGITLVLAIPSASTVTATLAASLGGTASATATPEHLAVLAASLGGTASATATRQTFATASTDLVGTASAAATPDHPATAAADLGGTSSSTATPDHPAVLAADLGTSASATADVTHIPVLAADLGGTAAATATRDTAAITSADLGGSATAVAAPDHPAVLSASLGGSADATATVVHPATATADLGFTASAEATIPGGPIDAVLAAAFGGTSSATAIIGHAAAATGDLGGTGTAAATVEVPALAVASLGGVAAATADGSHPAVLAADLGGSSSASAVLEHLAVAVADIGFTSAAAASVPPTADPNPTVIRLKEARTPVLADAGFPRLREPR